MEERQDLISRQAAIDALAKHEKSNGHNYTLFMDIVSECAEIIRDLPSAQSDIILCKDCKHKYVVGDNVQYNVCELNHNKVQSDEWYCADAERLEE